MSAWKQLPAEELSSQISETCWDRMWDLRSPERSEPQAILPTKRYIYFPPLPWCPPPKSLARPLFPTSTSNLLADTKLLEIHTKRDRNRNLGTVRFTPHWLWNKDPRTRKDFTKSTAQFPPCKQVNFQIRSLCPVCRLKVPNIYWGHTVCQALCQILQEIQKWAYIINRPWSCFLGTCTDDEQYH